MKKIAIKGNSNPLIAKLIIEKLEGMGGKKSGFPTGNDNMLYYYIDIDGKIDISMDIPEGYTEYDIMQDVVWKCENADKCNQSGCYHYKTHNYNGCDNLQGGCRIYKCIPQLKEKEQPKEVENCEIGCMNTDCTNCKPKEVSPIYPKTMKISNNGKNWADATIYAEVVVKGETYYVAQTESECMHIWKFAKDIEPVIKSAEEIFQNLHGFGLIGNNLNITLTKRHIFEAMEEYASQFKKEEK